METILQLFLENPWLAKFAVWMLTVLITLMTGINIGLRMNGPNRM